ncbi:MAG: Hpt domain-containing protein [Steroidobacteraceae bacterium]|jgi:HPt (histidine-containing phosphotransfer) domain-containing protein|nr:Hpt domain-containing protein [Steroidobacteraceae bacterium]
MADPPRDDRARRTGVLAGQLAALGDAFRARLLRDRESLAAAYAALAAADADAPASLKRIEHAAHRLHGTAAMFGYAKLGESAGRLERAARETLARGTSDGAAHSALAVSYAGLDGEFDAALARAPSGPVLCGHPDASPQTK